MSVIELNISIEKVVKEASVFYIEFTELTGMRAYSIKPWHLHAIEMINANSADFAYSIKTGSLADLCETLVKERYKPELENMRKFLYSLPSNECFIDLNNMLRAMEEKIKSGSAMGEDYDALLEDFYEILLVIRRAFAERSEAVAKTLGRLVKNTVTYTKSKGSNDGGGWPPHMWPSRIYFTANVKRVVRWGSRVVTDTLEQEFELLMSGGGISFPKSNITELYRKVVEEEDTEIWEMIVDLINSVPREEAFMRVGDLKEVMNEVIKVDDPEFADFNAVLVDLMDILEKLCAVIRQVTRGFGYGGATPLADRPMESNCKLTLVEPGEEPASEEIVAEPKEDVTPVAEPTSEEIVDEPKEESKLTSVINKETVDESLEAVFKTLKPEDASRVKLALIAFLAKL